jgi:hypothetical protein
VWTLLEPEFRAGQTFPHDPAITEMAEQLAWLEQSQVVMVAVDTAGAVVGTLPGAWRHQRLGDVDALGCSRRWWRAASMKVVPRGQRC